MVVLPRQLPPVIPTDPDYFTWSIQGQLRAISLSLMLLALITVLGRVYIRYFVLGVFRIDDYMIVAAMVRNRRSSGSGNCLIRFPRFAALLVVASFCIRSFLEWGSTYSQYHQRTLRSCSYGSSLWGFSFRCRSAS
jgi:hypothetical protein